MLMLLNREYIRRCLVCVFLAAGFQVQAQIDTTPQIIIDSPSVKQKGLLETLVQNFLTDTTEDAEKDLQRVDEIYRKYENRVIRKIIIQPIPFGVSIDDTSRRFTDEFIRLANNLHYRTRNYVVHNNLFFREGDVVSPFILGNNERYLRDLPFLQEAKIRIKPVRGTKDSVDVLVRTKDILSIGGSLSVHNANAVSIELKEDNFAGLGDRVAVQGLYDKRRNHTLGYGFEYYKRNIAGSFIDANAGYINFNNTFNGGRSEERLTFLRFVRPLVNPYMIWTYAFNIELHNTANMFSTDSLYLSNLQYKYRTYDAWAGWNLSSKNIGSSNEFQRLRFLLGLRVLDQNFLSKPFLYTTTYSSYFSNVFAVLSSVSLFKQNFYKTSYIYGFGRKEDLPEGIEASLSAGYTKREGRERPYVGLNFAINYVTLNESFFNYSLSTGASIYQKRVEDINLLAAMEYFTRLHQLGGRWKHRAFFNASFARQYNHVLDEPLIVESRYGLADFKNNYVGGQMRATVKAESVFFTPWQLFYFKFAPFVFSSATLFQFPADVHMENKRLYTSIGGGIRTRNESLIFGTLELRGAWFPKKDAFKNNYLIQVSTNLRFKYNQDFIRRPEFVKVN